MNKKLISIISPCYNEEDNIMELYERVTSIIDALVEYNFEYIFIDNASTDKTTQTLRAIANKDKRIKIILNTRNFGHIRSPYYGLLQTIGDATIYLASDLQDPPELIPKFLNMWEGGAKVVLAIKPVSRSNLIMHKLRQTYYVILDNISRVPIVRDATGFGLYDKVVIDSVRRIGDPYPFFRGLVSELGYKIKTVNFDQPQRKKGESKNNFYSLFDIAMLGVVSHSLVPMRAITLTGLSLGLLSIFFAIFVLVLKLVNWNKFPLGVAPLIIVLFFLFGVVLISIGILGEYIGSIHTYLQKRPIVVEDERIGFD